MGRFVASEHLVEVLTECLSGLWLFLILLVVPSDLKERNDVRQNRLDITCEVCRRAAVRATMPGTREALLSLAVLFDFIEGKHPPMLPSNTVNQMQPCHILEYEDAPPTLEPRYTRQNMLQDASTANECRLQFAQVARDLNALLVALGTQTDYEVGGMKTTLGTCILEIEKQWADIATICEQLKPKPRITSAASTKRPRSPAH